MKLFIIFVTVLSHLVLPFLFLCWVAFNKGSSKLYRLSVAVFVFSFLILMWTSGAGWGWFGRWWPWLFILLSIPALIGLIKNLHHVPWLPKKTFSSWVGTLFMVMLAALFMMTLPDYFLARQFEEKPLRLSFPMKDGTYLIGHGGSTPSMNQHASVKAQKYALDILKLNEWGIRAWGLMPKDLQSYEIYGVKLFAPCPGEIISAKDHLKDLVPPNREPKNLAGNQVILNCQGHSVLLAHLQQDSVVVETGDRVEEGELLGRVGNSGNTTEPHLHIHAVKGKVSKQEDITQKATGVPILFDGEFLIRNDRIVAP